MPQYFNFALNKTSIYYDDGVNYNIAAAPLYFVRSGHVSLANTAGTLRVAGTYGHYWSSRASSTNASGISVPSAYNLYFLASNVNPSYSDVRYRGFPLRCLSTVLGM